MSAIPQQLQLMTVEEYLEWEALQDIRYEYIEGHIFAMTGGSIPHNDIALNLYTALRPFLQSKGCKANVSDVKVQADPKSAYFYPDLVVTCDADDLKSRKFIQKPTLIVEVLSPGTSSQDRGKKFTYYRKMPSLQEYLLIDSENIFVERYQRGEEKMWFYYPYSEGDIVTLASINFEVPVELLYENVNLESEE